MNFLKYETKLLIFSFIDSFDSRNLRFTCKEWLNMPRESFYNTNFFKNLKNLRWYVDRELKSAAMADNLDLPYEIPYIDILKLNSMYKQIPLSISFEENFKKIIDSWTEGHILKKRTFI